MAVPHILTVTPVLDLSLSCLNRRMAVRRFLGCDLDGHMPLFLSAFGTPCDAVVVLAIAATVAPATAFSSDNQRVDVDIAAILRWMREDRAAAHAVGSAARAASVVVALSSGTVGDTVASAASTGNADSTASQQLQAASVLAVGRWLEAAQRLCVPEDVIGSGASACCGAPGGMSVTAAPV